MTEPIPNYVFICQQADRQRWLIDNEKKLTKEEKKILWDNIRSNINADVELDNLYYSVKRRITK